MTCECCREEVRFTWTDTHGVGVCLTCGLPYRILHYEENKRVEKPPAVALTDEGLEIARRYWKECKHRVYPAVYDMGFLDRRDGCSYSGASREEVAEFNEWYERNVEPAAQAAEAKSPVLPERGGEEKA